MGQGENRKKNNLDKKFLLIFHGGLVCYLTLHNLLIPIFRNFFQDNPFLLNVQYWFIPQITLFMAFVISPLNSERKTVIPKILGINLLVFALGIVEIIANFGGRFSIENFSSVISLISIAVFFIGYFSHFKKLYLGDSFHFVHDGIVSLVFGGGFFLLQYSLKAYNHPTSEKEVKEIVNEGEKIETVEINLPNDNFFNGNIILLSKEFSKGNVYYISSDRVISVKNETNKKHVLRLEKLRGTKWDFVRAIFIGSGMMAQIPTRDETIYRIRAPTGKEIGSFYIVKGSHKFGKVSYSLIKNRVKIKDE